MSKAPWQYVSFAAETFLGMAFIRAHSPIDASMIAHSRGINPGGQLVMIEIPEAAGDPPEEHQYKLFTDKEEIDRVCGEWLVDEWLPGDPRRG